LALAGAAFSCGGTEAEGAPAASVFPFPHARNSDAIAANAAGLCVRRFMVRPGDATRVQREAGRLETVLTAGRRGAFRAPPAVPRLERRRLRGHGIVG